MMDKRALAAILTIVLVVLTTAMALFIMHLIDDRREYPNITADDLGRFLLPEDLALNETIMEHVVLAGDYLLNHIERGGRWDYEYDAQRDDSLGSYNILRHAGTTYSLALIFKYTAEPRFYNGTIRSLNNLLSHYLIFGVIDGEQVAYLESGGLVKLGGAALAALAVSEVERIDPMAHYERELERLGQFIVEMQKEDGSFQCFYKHREDEHSDYYPGEALLALSKLYDLYRDEEFLGTLTKGLEHYNGYFPSSYSAYTPWATEAMVYAYEWTKNVSYVGKSFAMADACMSGQIKPGQSSDDAVIGAFSQDPTSATASRLEGIVDSYLLAHLSNDTAHQYKYGASMVLGADFLMGFQLNASDVEDLPDPSDSLGGVPTSLNDLRIRIDNVQHTVVVLLKIAVYPSNEGRMFVLNGPPSYYRPH